MPTLLTVDDSPQVRSSVSRCIRDLDVELLQAEDGAQALEVLAARRVDLVLLDVTMPVMDGAAMLRALRARGDQTPVILMTGDCRRQLVAEAMHLGLDEFILKPFRPDELVGKVTRALARVAPEPPDVVATGSGAIATTRVERPPADVLIVDDMELVHQRLRQALPAEVTLHGALGADDALARCEEHSFRVVLIDLVIPDVDAVALATRLRQLQPEATLLALAMRTVAGGRVDPPPGFAARVLKPFDPAGVAALVERVRARAAA